MSAKAHIAIIDWRTAPQGDAESTIETAIIKIATILDALLSGHLAGAGLGDEAATPNLIATCHAAFCSVESKIEMRSTSARIALAAVTGRPLENVVNGVV